MTSLVVIWVEFQWAAIAVLCDPLPDC